MRTSILLAPVLAGAITAQSMPTPLLIQGQDASFVVQSAPPTAVASFALDFTGIGAGPCFGPPVSLCLDLLAPAVLLPPVPANAAGQAQLTFIVPGNAPLVPVFAQALVADLPNGQLRVVKSNAVSATIDTLGALSDDFAAPVLAPQWQLHNAALVQLSVINGELHLLPTQAGPAVTWYADAEGPLVFKLVRGDFTVSAALRSYLPSNPSQPPTPTFRMGGITVRDPASQPGQRNWLHVAVGAGQGSTPIAVEDKTTVNSVSDLRLYPIAAPQGEVRVTRQGAVIGLWYRPNATSTWQLLRSHQRQDLGPVLQVGLSVFSWDVPVLVQTSVDAITFQ